MDPSPRARLVTLVVTAGLALAACGGGGGGGGGSTPPPTDNTAPSVPANVAVGAVTSSSVDLSWSASTDTGGSGLAGYRIYRDGAAAPVATVAATSYTDTGLANQTTYSYTVRAYDNAGNQSPEAGPVTATTAQAGNVTISGAVTFERPSYTASNRLDFGNLQRLPVRGATVEILRASDQSILATTTTGGTDGRYSATITSAPFIVRVKAQLRKAGAGGYDFEVRNNTSGNALYSLDSATVTPASSAVTVDLNAPTGWSSGSYTGPRAAAPFAILAMLWEARLLIQGVEPGVTMAAVDVYWSPLNNSADCDGQPNPVTGAIGTTFFLNGTIPATGRCPAITRGIYVLGDADGTADDDADEFDSSVIAHEFGHYFEWALSRSDSLGGPHSLGDRHDLTLAFSEGWGNAFQGFVLDDAVYRDTFGTAGSSSFWFDMDNNSAPFQNLVETSWYAEAAVHEILWDVYDAPASDDDQIRLGYGPIHQVMRQDMPATDALTSIYVMRTGLEERNPAQANAIGLRMEADRVFGTSDFGINEASSAASNNWPADPFAVPVYRVPQFGVAQSIVSVNTFADDGDTLFQSYNRLGSRRYMKIALDVAGGLSVRAVGPSNSDPDLVLYRKGEVVGISESAVDGLEEATFPGLNPGTYILEVAECSYLGELSCPGETPYQDPATGTQEARIEVTVRVTQP
jgi:hypothetical protein